MTEVHDQSAAGSLHPVDIASRKVGGRSRLAEILGVSASAIGNWKERGIPAEHCQALRRITEGELTLQQMRPNDWLKYWPELARQQGEPTEPESSPPPHPVPSRPRILNQDWPRPEEKGVTHV